MILKIDAKLVEKLICYFKNDKNLVKTDLSNQSLNNLHFRLFLLCKVFNFRPEKVQKNYLS